MNENVASVESAEDIRCCICGTELAADEVVIFRKAAKKDETTCGKNECMDAMRSLGYR